MEVRIRPIFVALSVSAVALVALCAVVFVHVAWNRSPGSLIARLPSADGMVVFVNLAAIRSAGLLGELQAIDVAPEREYLEFVENTGFDYEQDLDVVVGSFEEFETFLLLRGRFDWGRLRDYIESMRGSCYNGFCQVTGSSEDRQISFFAVTPDVMALAVGADPWAASLLMDRGESPVGEMPAAPVWISAPGNAVATAGWLPAAARTLASQLNTAERVTLSLSPAGADFETRLRVDCASAEDASGLTAQYQKITDSFAVLAGSEDEAVDSPGLGDVLKNGRFRSEGTVVTGTWPVSEALLRTIVSGGG